MVNLMGVEEKGPHACSAPVLAMTMMMSAAHEFRMWHRKRYGRPLTDSCGLRCTNSCLCRMQDIGRIGYCVCAGVCARSSLACRSGNRAAVSVSASGNGSLVSLAGTNLLPAVCQLDWICPPGHACDSVALVKVRPYKPFLRLIPLTSRMHRVSQIRST